ncbi:MAG: MFS transporter, partial [Candidatus Latescibacteria bacterium]|nr:MFS transporter [Candidatus Latescibacterota bacterium]
MTSTWKALVLPVYFPTFLLAFGSGILIPTLPLFAGSFDLSFSMISLVIAGSSIGTVIGDVPAGMLLERINRRTGMIAGVAIILV